jgi:hypothetical protein
LQAEIDVCTAELTAQFKPRSAYEVRLVKEMGRATAQAEFAELHIQVEQHRATSRVPATGRMIAARISRISSPSGCRRRLTV